MSSRLVVLAALALALPGCLGALTETPAPLAAEGLPTTDVRARAALPFVLDENYSRPLVAGALGILPAQSIHVPVKLALDELGSAVDGSAKVHMGLWLPDVPPGTKVPVIADIGPYYSDGDLPATEPANRLGKFLIENYVPHGYAVAQVSVFGSGESTHCMDLMGRAEQLGIDAAVTFLGTQEWSNGNVGLIGRSYDGSTPWEAAMFGNEHLKTIVPISGLVGQFDLMWKNGSAEGRGPLMHNAVYGRFGIDSAPAQGRVDPGDAYTLCTDYMAGPANGAAAYATGAPTAYWRERSFLDAALQNYEGSVYLIHGLQDWNVDPHMAFPVHQKVEEAGLEIKGLYGQWGHMYPDRAAEHERLPEGKGKEAYPASVRLDWAQDLLEWFDHYLKGTGAKPSLHVEVQDNTGGWRVEDTYPPLDATWVEAPLSGAAKKHIGPDVVLGVASGGFPAPNVRQDVHRLAFVLPPLSDTEDVRIAGLPQLHVKATPAGAGGQLFALLKDAKTGQRLGHAVMDLRYADGGSSPRAVAPGQSLVAKMEFFAIDAVLPAGHGLVVELASTGEDYRPSVVTAPVAIDVAGTVLRVPTVERGEDAFFLPPGPVGPAKGDVITS